MKQFFTFCTFLFIIGSVSAQITVTSVALPQPGDTFVMRYDINPSINIGTPWTADQTWDFSMLENDSLKYATYGFTSSLPFAAEYPQSNLYTWGPSVMYGGPGTPLPGTGWGWMLFRTDVNGMDVIGYRQGDAPNVLAALQTPPLKLMKTPCAYDTVFNQTSQWSIEFNAVPTNADTLYVSSVSKTLECDAWGTLSTPIEQNVEVLRIHEYQVSVDSVFGKMNGIVVYKMELRRDTANNYLFYSTTKRHPIASVWCRPNGDIYAAEYLFYSDLYNNITENTNNQNSIIYPNPAINQFKIDSHFSNNAMIEVINIQGKIVFSGNIPQDGILNCESWDSGIYFLLIRDSNKTQTKKLIISNR